MLESRALGLSPLQQQQLLFAHTSYFELHRIYRAGTVSTAWTGPFFDSQLYCIYYVSLISWCYGCGTGFSEVMDGEGMVSQDIDIDVTGQRWYVVDGWKEESIALFGLF